MDFIPEKSEIQIANIKGYDQCVKDLIRDLGIKQLVNQHNVRRQQRNWTESSQHPRFWFAFSNAGDQPNESSFNNYAFLIVYKNTLNIDYI